MEENHSRSAALAGMPYLRQLSQTYAQATNLRAITHPSLPNYFAFTSGSTQGVTTDCGSSTAGCTKGALNIYKQANGWAQWSESMPKPCDHQNASPYVVHHAIAPYYTDLAATCPARDVRLVKTNVPTVRAGFTFITPNNQDNAHSGSLAAADSWLKVVMGQLLGQSAYKNGQVLVEVTFDEGSGSQNVAAVFIHPSLHGVTLTMSASHYSTLRLNEELLGVGLLGGAKTAPDLRGGLGL